MVSDLKTAFRIAAAAHGAGKILGDVEATNDAFDQKIAVVRQLRHLPDKGRQVLTELLSDTGPAVRSSAATYLLPLDENLALPVLEEVCKSPEPFIGLTAEMVLREWRAGRLEIP
ncbi:MAG: DUF2019 domain-containing protein [Alphaproteobacteria bacterium]|nr:DUF2019 domain-containing protein [Alphaproteobacteria bacterium]